MKRKGFTLIEFLVSIFIASIIIFNCLLLFGAVKQTNKIIENVLERRIMTESLIASIERDFIENIISDTVYLNMINLEPILCKKYFSDKKTFSSICLEIATMNKDKIEKVTYYLNNNSEIIRSVNQFGILNAKSDKKRMIVNKVKKFNVEMKYEKQNENSKKSMPESIIIGILFNDGNYIEKDIFNKRNTKAFYEKK